MLGMIEFDGSNGRPCCARRQILGGTFLTLNLGKSACGLLSHHHAARWAKRMREQGVRRAVFPLDFSHTASFVRLGVLPVDPLPLQKKLCAACVRRQLDVKGIAPGQAVVAVVGDRMSRELEETARSLVVSCRYVFLSVPTGGESFAREMRRKYGAALILRPSRDQLEQADALVLYAPRPELQQKNKVLCALYPGAAHGGGRMVLTLDEALMANIPPNCAADQLAAALYDLGVLPQEKIKCEITC